ncbi:hypothetical protein [Saccharothrix xinjiangensis]|uniref:hypothetical protein n=1 Tax=Saccharothrix xinjiangensis TaxID=204798 RepID=UPI0031DECB90
MDPAGWGVSGYRAADRVREHQRVALGLSDHRRVAARLTHTDDRGRAVGPATAPPGPTGGARSWTGRRPIDDNVGVPDDSGVPEHHNRVTGPAFQPVVQARDISGGVHLGAGSPAARSRYREQVRQIAPPELVGREAELAELAEFCLGADAAGGYRWWRAPKWAGKSALLSWFVLHPPPGVRVVSFFVTGRLAGQDHRGAFVDVVLEQLAELLAEPLPALLPEATREAHLVGMLAEAAELCRSRGERLVLVVDGLDEDRGAAAPTGAHSIAALLPANPAAGMRVVVSGRPNPPAPADLSPHHPLRDPAITRDLAVSARARVLRDDMELELDRLLRGGPAERDLLGLVVAAAGGLGGRDLAELTGRGEHEVRRQLRTVAGRSFDVRPGRWRPGTIYLLGHEELQASAEERLGDAALAGCRERLHRWADRYRDLGWPEDTPEYLLRGYHRLLLATGDTARLVAAATDPARHDRVLDLSGGDVEALGEIGATQDALLAAERPDLPSLARLAVHRDRLVERGSTIPERLPALWASLGNVARAEALTDPVRGPVAAVHVAGALAAAGHLDRAEELAAAITDPDHRTEAQLALVESMVAAGHVERAVSVVRALLSAQARVAAALLLARAAAEAGDGAEALRLAGSARTTAESLSGSEAREHAIVTAAEAAVVAGDLDGAEELCDAITNQALAFPVMARLAVEAARVGDHERARRLAGSVERRAPTGSRPAVIAMIATRDAAEVDERVSSIKPPGERVKALVALAAETGDPGPLDRAVELLPELGGSAAESVVEAFSALGDVRRAEEVATAHGVRWPSVLVSLGQAAVAHGQPEAARRDPAEAEVAARSTSASANRQAALRSLVLAHAARGDTAEARRLAAALSDATGNGRLDLVRAEIALGEPGRAEQLALGIEDDRDRMRAIRLLVEATRDHDEAERLVRLAPDARERVELLVRLARDLAAAGSPDRAEDIARSMPDGHWRVEALVAALSGAPEFSTRAAGHADALPHLPWRARLLTAAARAGRDDALFARADAVVRRMGNPLAKVRALLDLADGGRATGRRGLARSALARAGVALPGIARPGHRARAALALVAAHAALGDHDRAAELARSFDGGPCRAKAETLVVRALAVVEDFDRAEAAASAIPVTRYRVEAFQFLVKALATAGLADRALDLVEEIAPGRPRSRALVSVIGALAANPAHLPLDRVEALVDALPDQEHRSDALEALARDALRRGDHVRAEAVVAGIQPAERRAELWRLLLDDPGHRATGRPAAFLLSTVKWSDALGAVAGAHPEVLDVVTAEFDLVDR